MFITIKVNLTGPGWGFGVVFLSSSGAFHEESGGEFLLHREELCRWQSCIEVLNVVRFSVSKHLVYILSKALSK